MALTRTDDKRQMHHVWKYLYKTSSDIIWWNYHLLYVDWKKRQKGTAFMRKTIIIIVFGRWRAACSTCALVHRHKSNTFASVYALWYTCCANIYSISSLQFPQWMTHTSTWSTCAHSLLLHHFVRRQFAVSRRTYNKIHGFEILRHFFPFVPVLVRRRYLPFDKVNLQRFTAEITLYCVCRVSLAHFRYSFEVPTPCTGALFV